MRHARREKEKWDGAILAAAAAVTYLVSRYCCRLLMCRLAGANQGEKKLAMCMWDDDTARRPLRTSTCRVRGRYGRDFRLVLSHIQLGRLPVLYLHVYVSSKGTHAVLPDQADICGAVRPAYRTPCVGQHSKKPRTAPARQRPMRWIMIMDRRRLPPCAPPLPPVAVRFMGAV
ncbi:hypothetical protein LX32DRAFT_323400 [Colletotrichum zoysiae]|uniref:Uncharacterized protein n=1 Tax=Colletotrichum zoysiae TaxID=1216348 RepID=A0AAD9HJR8_9PEZI|nr:hypothetical protein LX32DRAFT_323400 [Colletotrichum zoysiae]